MGGPTPSLSEETLAAGLGNAVTQSYAKARTALAPIAGGSICLCAMGRRLVQWTPSIWRRKHGNPPPSKGQNIAGKLNLTLEEKTGRTSKKRIDLLTDHLDDVVLLFPLKAGIHR